MKITRSVLILACSMVLLLASCEDPLPPEEDYRALAEAIEQGVQTGEIDETYKKFNSSLFMKNLKEKIVLPIAERNALKQLIKDRFYEDLQGLSTQYSEQNNGTIQFDTLYFEDRTAHLVFSTLSISGELNFIDFYVDVIENKLFISDYLSYFAGVRLSHNIHQIARSFHSNNSDRRKLGKNPFYKANQLLTKVSSLYAEGACNEAWETFHEIDETFQQLPTSMVLKVLVSSCTEPVRYEIVTKEFIKHELVTEQSKLFHQLSLAARQQDIAAFDVSSTALKKYIGRDENITLLKAVTLMNAQEYEGALVYMNRCFDQLSNSLYTHKMKLLILMGAGKIKEAQESYATLKNQFDVNAEFLNNLISLYPELEQQQDTSI